MKKLSVILLLMVQLTLISACSQNETLTFEEQIKEVMVKNNYEFDSAWHFEIKGNIIIIFYDNKGRLDIYFIENSNGKWELKTGMGALDLEQGGYLTTFKEMGLPFNFTVVVHPEENVKGISVLGESTKLVQISPEKKVWFAFTNKPANGYEIEK
ncbi:hypothetical protein [Sporosarcina sp. FA9]|uniref:hypothetical protein n=1 Tax=Sporosarcina sp. FA9 TaxID=3413030 RepID=UPI003F658FEB